jgi:hypothetical protein
MGKQISDALFIFAIGALTLLCSNPAYAQGGGATLSGTVTDLSGAVIPKAQISAKNTATGVNRNSETNSDGFYTVPGLPPATMR